EAEKCDTVAMIREGKILAHGSPGELKAMYEAADLNEVFLKAGRAVQ
ncbi:MAG: ABC transporter ATP-binding protein, partial [Heyndrickxia faecalis]